MNITISSLDLAKNVFHFVGCNQSGKILKKKVLKREDVLMHFSNMAPCLVAMEACAGAHHWAREIERLGHQVVQIAPQHVKAFLRGNKNDYNDALAICEAAMKPEMRFVSTKTIEQQDIQVLHRLRETCVRDRTASSNEIRGLLAEYGIVFPAGIHHVYQKLPALFDKEASNGLTPLLKGLLERHYQKLTELKEHADFYTKEIQKLSQNDECKRLQTIPGFGPIVSSAFYQHTGNGASYKNGRCVSASVGLVPRQHSSGGRERLQGISKRGNGYLRKLLVQGARSAMIALEKKNTPLANWLKRLIQTQGRNKAVVALANKLARIGWAILKHGGCYHEELLEA